MPPDCPNPRLPDRPPAGAWISFLAHFFFILSAWTVVIKYLFPIAFSAAMGEPLTTHIFWDLWPVAHVWMGWALLRWPPYTVPLAIGMSVVEIIIIVTLFHRFLSSENPEWTIWRTNWFINKIFVLSAFVLLLGTFLLRRQAATAGKVSPKPHPQAPQPHP